MSPDPAGDPVGCPAALHRLGPSERASGSLDVIRGLSYTKLGNHSYSALGVAAQAERWEPGQHRIGG